MRHLRAIGAFTILGTFAWAQDSPRPDLGGAWHVFDPQRPQVVIADLMVTQSGDDVVVRCLPPGKPEIVIYEGKFETNRIISGRALDTNAPQENRWTDVRSVIRDANHVQLGPNMIIRRGAPWEAVTYALLKRMASEQLPATPFDLAGTWAFEGGQQVLVTGVGGNVMLRTEKEGQFFRGRYASNPAISGQGLRRETAGSSLEWRATQLTVLDPDHLMFLGHVVYRTSNPPPHDVSCDARDTSHVKDSYARMRGASAYSEKDYKTARCWLAIGADWGSPPAQSLLAAFIIQGSDGVPPDYALAFDLAKRAAEAGDSAGQLQLASMYKNGKGTVADPEKAEFWLQKAEKSQEFAKMRAVMTPENLTNSIGQVMGMAGSLVDFNLSMTPNSCFSQEVLGNRPTAACPQ